jgi:hypothetical protein
MLLIAIMAFVIDHPMIKMGVNPYTMLISGPAQSPVAHPSTGSG